MPTEDIVKKHYPKSMSCLVVRGGLRRQSAAEVDPVEAGKPGQDRRVEASASVRDCRFAAVAPPPKIRESRQRKLGLLPGEEAAMWHWTAFHSGRLLRIAKGGHTLGRNGKAASHYKKMYDRVSGLAKIGVWECDLNSEELTWTDTVYDLFELPRGRAISRDDTLKLYGSNSRVEMERLRNRAISTGIGFALDIQLELPSGNDRWIRLTAEIEKEAGKPVRIFGTKQDISAEKAAQDKVQSLQNRLVHVSRVSAMGAMASTLAHEVNQPLAAASNYLAVARRLASLEPAPSDLLHCIQAALDAIHRAGRTIRSVREIDAKGRVDAEDLEIEQVVKEAARLATAGNPNVTLSYDIGSIPPVKADCIQIQQVVFNLIRNACEAADGRPCQISISGSASEASYELRVSDSGPGIPVAILPNIFEAFVSTKPDAVGIGLSISRTIVEAHGGHIRATNSPKGGATFCFDLPLAERLSSALPN